MTPKETFYAAYKRVCKARDRQIDNDHAGECWRVIQSQSASLFDFAATRLNATSTYFPSPKDWLDACRAIDGEQTAARARAHDEAAEAYRQERTYHCLRCLDTGKEQSLHCTADDWCGICRRQGRHLYDHTYCRPCACRESNPVWQAYLAKLQEQADHGKGQRRAA